MKIAIKGHSTRGKEVIQILESLGGENTHELCGNGKDCVYYYHIDSCGIITLSSKYDLHNYKFYTLEEFEKEFPFKIGDKVVWDKDNYTAIRTVLRIDYSDLAGIKYAITAFGAANCFWEVDANELKSYKEMKEERFVTLTLDKAKEWYKKGGELREIALQAFTEKELNPLPRSWEEFYEQGNPIASWRYNIAIKYDALIKLEQLRDCWRQGWEPNWDNVTQTKYCICCCRGEFKISTLYETRCFLTFPTIKMAEEFLECFRDLIEKAGDLI